MKRYLWIAALVIALMGCMTQSAFAKIEKVTYNDATKKVTITGTAKTKNEEITLLVLKKDVTKESYDAASRSAKKGLIEMSKQVTADADGMWTFRFSTAEQNTNQLFRLREKNGTEVSVLPVYGEAVVVAAVNGATADTMESVLTLYEPYLNYNTSNAYKNIYTTLSAGEKAYVYAEMAAQTFSGISQIDPAFEQYIALSVIAKAQGADYLTENDRLVTSAEVLGIDMTSYKALSESRKLDVCTGLVIEFIDNGKPLTKDTLSTKLAALAANPDSVVIPGGGSFGGGGGGAGNAGSNPTPDISFDAPSDTSGFASGNKETSIFKDLATVEWARESIEELAKLRIINGKADGIFAPNDTVTREELVKMAVGIFGLLDRTAECDFEDTDKNEWYYVYVASGTKIGLVQGMGNGRFGIGQAITRQDLATILWNGAKDLIKTEAGKAFADDYEISDYAKTAVSMLRGAGIIDGMGDNEFMPQKNATRAEAAKLIYMTLQSMK